MTHIHINQSKIINGIDIKTPPLVEPPPRVTIGNPPEKLTVVCVWYGNLYPRKYVEILRNSIKRHLTIPYEFYCLSDHKEDIDDVIILPTINTNSGWWQKVNLFNPNLFKNHKRILYLDLDTIITNSIDKIANAKEDFCIIENFGPNKHHSCVNSSVMLWTPNKINERIYTKFSPEVMKHLHGDQNWIWCCMGNNNMWNFPKEYIVSYKYSKFKQWNFIGKETSVYVFHGDPKPNTIKDYPKEHWK